MLRISYVISNRSHGTEVRASCTPEDTRNFEADGDLNTKMAEYNNEVYIVTWTTGQSGDLQDDIQLRSLMISSTKLGILVRDVIMKNTCLSLGSGFNKMLEDVMQQARISTFDQLRMHPSSADSLKSIDSKLSIPQAHGSECHQEMVPMERVHVLEEDLNQNIRKVLRQERLFAKYSKNCDHTRHPEMEDAAWTQELDTINQKRIFIFQKNSVDLTHNRFSIKLRAENIFALSAFTHLFRSCSMGNMLPFVSPFSSGISLIQHSIPFLSRDDRKDREKMFQLQSGNAAVDSSNSRTSVSARTRIINEQNTMVLVLSISRAEGGYILVLLYKTSYNHSIQVMLGYFNEKP